MFSLSGVYIAIHCKILSIFQFCSMFKNFHNSNVEEQKEIVLYLIYELS